MEVKNKKENSEFFIKKDRFEQLNWCINRISDNNREQGLTLREFLVVLKEVAKDLDKRLKVLEELNKVEKADGE